MNPYIPLMMLFAFAALLGVVILILSHLINPKKYAVEKMQTYECGFDPIGDSRHRFSVKFYLVAMLFILFDVEIALLYPWAVFFGAPGATPEIRLFALVELLVFVGILAVGYVYLYKAGAFDWAEGIRAQISQRGRTAAASAEGERLRRAS